MRKLLLAVSVALLSALTATAQTTSWDDGNFTFTNSAGSPIVSVRASSTGISGDIVIPSQVSHGGTDYPVAEIEMQGFAECRDITSVKIPSSVTDIYGGAFYDCQGLVSADLSECSITEVPGEMFMNCYRLTSVSLPETVTTIQMNAFESCGITSLDFLPASVTDISDEAFANCKIGYIKVANWTTIGYNAFAGQRSELTVDFSDFQDVPDFVQDLWGSPFSSSPHTDSEGQSRLGCLRVIVPVGCVSKYLSNQAMGTIPYHNYRVKFKLGTHSGDTPAAVDYTLYNITPQQRLIATSSWKNDYLCFRPEVIIDEATVSYPVPLVSAKPTVFEDEGSTSASAQSKRIVNISPSAAPPGEFEEEASYVYSNTVDVWDETSHAATPILVSSKEEEVRGVMGDEVAIENPNAFFTGYSFSGTDPANYPQSLMPYSIHSFHANAGSSEVEQIGRRPVGDGIVPCNTGIIIDFPKPATYLVPPALYVGDEGPIIARYNMSLSETEFENVLTNKTWERVENAAAAYNGEWKVLDWADLRHPVSTNPLKFKFYEWGDGVRVDHIRDSINNHQYSSCKELTWEDLKNSEITFYASQEYWPDVDQLYQDQATISAHFNANHNSATDHNVIIGTPDRYPLFPYWAASPYPSDAAHDDPNHPDVSERFSGDTSDPLNFKYAEYGRMGTGYTASSNGNYGRFFNFATQKDINGNDATLDSDIEYINFGVSKGYFVQVKSEPALDGSQSKWTQPNRAYFSISRFHMPHLFDNTSDGKLAIFIEGTDSEPTGIRTIDEVTPATHADAWYTLQGVRLAKKPTTNGIYIHNGKKIVIK